MVADGVIRGVQIKRGDPVDTLLRSYYEGLFNADMISMYVATMPLTNDTLQLIDTMIKNKYPFLDNATLNRQEEIDKYNKAWKMAKRYTQSKREK